MQDHNTPPAHNGGVPSRHSIDTANLNAAVRPADDFYSYACGGWMKKNPLPAEFSRFGVFDLLREKARNQLRELITNLSQEPQAKTVGTNAQKVADLYALGMDAERLNREGAAPLAPYLEKINSLQPDRFTETLAWMHNGITGSFFSTGVGPDSKNSDLNIMHIGETGLGLGDRDYYLEDNDTNRRILGAYRDYIVRIMTLAGYSHDDAVRVRDTVMRMETDFARHKMTREERRNPQARYNIRTMAQLQADYPNIAWEVYFKALGVEAPPSANVSSPGFIAFLNDFLPKLSIQDIRDYLAYEFVSDSSNLLSDPFIEANFEMFGRVMSGTEEQQPRWKRAMAMPNSMFGEAVGELYVARYFPQANKDYMKNLVENLRDALRMHIDSLPWMGEATRLKAREKLEAMTVKIGYPDKWKDYSGISIDPEKSYLENVLRASVWYTADNYSKLGKPVDRNEWHMTPQTVNAYYSPTSNEICFPAGILQAPYFDPGADDALNYGAIGVVIGHEMTHGFDDQGRQFDKEGNLNDWWTPEDASSFTALANRLAALFDTVEVAPGVKANGRYTLGENIADQGGLRVALTAYTNTCGSDATENIGDFSPLQRFFLSYANLWAENIRDEEILSRTKTDPHSLGRNRVNETLKNLPPFFDAFGIKAGDPMYRTENDRVLIW